MPNPSVTCCNPGYHYNPIDELCHELDGNLTEAPIDCPCCPDGYHYVQHLSSCINDVNSRLTTNPIICIPCSCTTPVITPCPACGSLGLVINFAWNFNESNCTSCSPSGPPQESKNCGLNRFLPIQILSPVIYFKKY